MGRFPPNVLPNLVADRRPIKRQGSGVEVVTFLTVLGKVESGGFLIGRDAETDDFVDDEEQDQR